MRIRFLVIIFLFLLSQQSYSDEGIYYSKVYYSANEAIHKIFPNTDSFLKKEITLDAKTKQEIEKKLGFFITNSKLVFYKVSTKDNLIGYCLVLDEKGKYKPITFMTGITSDLKVKQVVVMVYREKIGSEIRKKRFLKQFINKTKSDGLVVDKDIMGISGATISTWSIASGVKRALVIIGYLI